MNFKISAAMVALTTCAAPAAMASTIIVDDFTTPGSLVATLLGNPAEGNFVGGADILGGTRQMWVSTDDPGEPIGTALSASGNGTIGFTNGTADPLATPATTGTGQAVLIYDGGLAVPPTPATPFAFTFTDLPVGVSPLIDVDTDGLGGIDFLMGAATNEVAINFDVNSFDSESIVEFNAYVWDTSGNLATYDETLVNPFLVDIVTFDSNLFLNQFTTVGAFDWTEVGAFAFSVESLTSEFDNSLGVVSVSVVPLPASALLLLGGLGGLAGVSATRRRRRKA